MCITLIVFFAAGVRLGLGGQITASIRPRKDRTLFGVCLMRLPVLARVLAASSRLALSLISGVF